MNKDNENFEKMFYTVDGIRVKKNYENITQKLLFDLLVIEEENYDVEHKVVMKNVIDLFDDYFNNIPDN